MRLLELFSPTAPAPLYVCRHLINAEDLTRWAREQGFRSCLPASEFHVTIAYSKAPVNWQLLTPEQNKVRVKNGKRTVEKLGNAIVLRFESKMLSDRWQFFIDDAGCSWDFPSYLPHVSITYESDGIDIDDIEPYGGDLVFGPEVFDAPNSDFADTFDEVDLAEATP